jgi:hypothetical protein
MTLSGGVLSGTPTVEDTEETIVVRFTNSGGTVDVSAGVTIAAASSEARRGKAKSKE